MEDLDQIKSDPGCLRVYSQYIRLKKVGDKYSGCCCLHQEKTPSFTIYPDMRYQCFGCGEAGNIFQLVQKMDNCDFKTAVEKVKKELGSWGEAKTAVESVFKSVAEQKIYKTIPLSAWSKLEDNLAKSKPAIKFLWEERGIPWDQAAKLRLGFVQNLNTLAGEAGADIADKGWIAFPCIEGDKIVSVKYRSTQRKKPGGFARQPGMETAMFNTDTISPFEPVYLTEGEFDACILEAAGFRAVSVPSAGTKLTPEMKDKLMQASEVILAGDTDPTGSGYTAKLWKELSERTYLLTWPTNCKDANQTFLENCSRDLEKFRALVKDLTSKAKLQPMPDVYSIQSVLENGDVPVLSEHPDRLRFPWSSADKMVNVLPEDVLGVGSTNTGMGKTMWTVQLSLFNARKYGKTVLNYQVEMRPSEIATMIAAQVLRRDRNFLTVEDRKLAASELDGVNYYVGNNPLLTDINEVLDVIEAAVRRLGADIVILDHFHHLTTGMDNETKIQQTAMTRIKQIAQVYKVIFINVGQPRKATQQTKGKQLHISDFKGSGAWGDAANAAIVLHRDLNKSEDPTLSKGVYEDKTLVKLLKGRSMGTGASATYITCFGEFASFEQLESNYEEAPSEIS
jgi:CHC2-type zinc finger protein/DnaB helicase-like protein/Toprim domain-containing protein